MPASLTELLLLLLLLVPDYEAGAQTCKQNVQVNVTESKNRSFTDGSEMHAPYARGQNCSWVPHARAGARVCAQH